MASLTARANTGAGTDTLAGYTTPDGFAGAVVVVDETGSPVAERQRVVRARRRRDDEAVIALLMH